MKSLVQKLLPREKCQFSNCTHLIASHCILTISGESLTLDLTNTFDYVWLLVILLVSVTRAMFRGVRLKIAENSGVNI